MVCRRTGHDPAAGNPGTRVFHDLGLGGDDAAEFLAEFAKRYAVDLAGFEFDRYFPPEWDSATVLSTFGLEPTPTEGRSPLTISYLERAAVSGRWVE